MRLTSIVGVRPQFIKLASVSRALRQRHEEIIIHTGQHYDYSMSKQFFDELSIPSPDYHLNCGSGSHAVQTARMLVEIESVLLKEDPDFVIVYGSTNSTLAGALAAAKLHIPIAHVEAGLRCYNRSTSDEINRVVTDHLSDRLFCPTETARICANKEGIIHGVEVVGDVTYEIMLQLLPKIDSHERDLLSALNVFPQEYLLATAHRPYNVDSPTALQNIAFALNEHRLPVIFPVHPRTRKCLESYNITWKKHIQLIDPVGYLDMLALERSAYRVLTDSGSVQKEAFLLGVPCITLREETEWSETVDEGWNILVGNDSQAIIEALRLPNPKPPRQNPFGRGDAASLIARSL